MGGDVKMKKKFIKGLGIGLGIGLSLYLTNLYRDFKEKEAEIKERDTFGTGQ